MSGQISMNILTHLQIQPLIKELILNLYKDLFFIQNVHVFGHVLVILLVVC